MSLAPNLARVSPLLGTWRGEGSGYYPTIDDFSYTEEVTFTDVGKPFLLYVQRTWGPDGSPMHTETGYLRVVGPGAVEFVLSQPTGQAELAEGTLTAEGDTLVIELEARVLNTATAKHVENTRRTYRLAGDTLTTAFDMAAVGQEMTRHLDSRMRRA